MIYWTQTRSHRQKFRRVLMSLQPQRTMRDPPNWICHLIETVDSGPFERFCENLRRETV